MNKKNKIMWILCALNWVFCFIAIAVSPYSSIAWWIMFSLQIVCLVGIIVLGVWSLIDLKREWKELDRKLEEDRKRLEELIKGYLVASLKEENQEDKEG